MSANGAEKGVSVMSKAAGQAGAPRISRSAKESLSPRGSLAMGVINTEVLDRGQQRDVLTSPEALARWWAEACKRYPDECAIEGAGEPIAWTGELLDAVRTLRTALRTLLVHVVERHAVEEADLQPVNAILALGYCALERSGQDGVKAVMHLHEPGNGSVLVPIACSALRLFTESDWRRLHQCKSDRCILFFYDTTKSGTRRWCSPGCMNRARSIRHYQLTKKGIPLG
jgi:predicted RNA-binding Zn ribbon-like protein